MSDPEGEGADAAMKLSAREAYLRNQQAVASSASVDHTGWTPMRVATLVAGVIAIGLYVATVASYYNNPQEDGSTDIGLPTATSFASLATLFLVVLPFLLESRTVGARVRNTLIAAVVALVLALICIAVFVELGSLVADLLYNVSH